MSTFYTSDTHFGHPNIIRYCSRPFIKPGDLIETGEEAGQWTNKFLARRAAARMDNFIIEKWNNKIGPDDDVYHNGDFAYGMPQHIIPLLRALNGRIHFIWGNHDRGVYEFSNLLHFYPDLKKRVFFLGDYAEINIHGQNIVLAHYSIRVWNRSQHGAWHFYG